jgi:hypothetical protein
MVKDTDFPVRVMSTKDRAPRFIRKKDIEEWLWWNKNIVLFLAYNPDIKGIQHCVKPDLFARLERSQKQFDRVRPMRRPVVNAITGECFASTSEAAKATYTGRTTIWNAVNDGRLTKTGEKWVWADEFDRAAALRVLHP